MLFVAVGSLAIQREEAVSTPLSPMNPDGDLNVIVVLVDDMDDFSCADTGKFLPESRKWLRGRGRCYERATVTSPACCPSRAALQTGQFPHNNHVERQIDARRLKVQNTIQATLGRAGFDTYGIGKFFNGVKVREYVSGKLPTGFDDFDFWQSSKYYRHKLFDDAGRKYLPRDGKHTTTRTGDLLQEYVEKQADSGDPFYAYAAFHAPHTQSGFPAGRKEWPIATRANRRRPVPKFDFNPEEFARDKLSPFRKLDRGKRYYEGFWKARVRALYDVDHEVAQTFELLRKRDLLDNTAVIFTSDNGFHLGENNWESKADPYPKSIHVPMLAYLPRAFGKKVVDRRMVSLTDIAPTLYDLLGVTTGHTLDGRSLLGRYGRKWQFHEFENEQNRFVLQESGKSPFRVPSWAMVTKGKRAYVEFYGRGGSVLAREFYEDAKMKRNLLHSRRARNRPRDATLKRFKNRLHKYQHCAGTARAGLEKACP